jgi:chromosome partitioning protein
VLVVVSPGYFELDSLVQLGKTLEEVREYYNPNLDLLGYLFTMSEPTINTSASLQILRQTYTEKVLQTVIPRNSQPYTFSLLNNDIELDRYGKTFIHKML